MLKDRDMTGHSGSVGGPSSACLVYIWIYVQQFANSDSQHFRLFLQELWELKKF